MAKGLFKDRRDAGHRLGRKLLRFKERHPVVLALPRGGVPVGFEIARQLEAPLDIILVRRIVGAPSNPGRTVGMVVDGVAPEIVADARLTGALGLSPADVEREAAQPLAEIARRRHLYLGDRGHLPLTGRLVILADDGSAGGEMLQDALLGIRHQAPARLVLALPVAVAGAAPPEGVDEVVCLSSPPVMEPLSHYYADFRQLHDGEVISLLRQSEGLAA